MIVRISGEGQYRLEGGVADRLNDIDNQAVQAADRHDEKRWRELFDEMLKIVRAGGTPLAVDELVGSDVILPPPDMTFAEAVDEFTGEGLIPD